MESSIIKKSRLVFSGVLVSLLCLFGSVPAFAATMLQTELLGKDQVINDNLWIAGENPTVLGAVNGDVTVAGGKVTVDSEIKGDLLVAGGNVTINGTIDGDVRVFAGQVTLSGNVTGDVVAMAGQVDVNSSTQIGKDLIIGAGEQTISPSVKVLGKKIILNEEAKKVQQAAEKSSFTQNVYFEIAMATLFWVAVMSIVAIVMYGFAPGFMAIYLKNATRQENVWKHLGLGFAMLVGLPVLVLICLTTILGSLLGVLLLFGYVLMILSGMVFGGMVFGYGAQQYFAKTEVAPSLLWLLGGILVVSFLSILPYVGWVIGFVFFLTAIGSMVTTKFELIKRLGK